ncbi:MAG: hypothetical protein GC201_11840 [Alphaproteobacteria bacterium]|nr:hypothetical protein [Alphaproteobacteria bacterium]
MLYSNRHAIRAALVVAAAALPAAAHAEHIDPGQSFGKESAFTSYLGSPRTYEALSKAARELDSKLGETCATDYTVKVSNITVYEPVEIVSGEEPSKGVWRVYYDVSRCGRDTHMSSLGKVKDGKVDWTYLVPGESKASDELVVGLKEALPRASGIEGCDDVFVVDTKLGGPEGVQLTKPDQPHETWVVRGCGKTTDLIWRFQSEKGSDQVQAVLENRLPRQ